MPALHFFEHGRLSLRCRADAEREGIPDVRMWEGGFEVGSLGSGGISEVA
jgi:hypothetical protein